MKFNKFKTFPPLEVDLDNLSVRRFLQVNVMPHLLCKITAELTFERFKLEKWISTRCPKKGRKDYSSINDKISCRNKSRRGVESASQCNALQDFARQKKLPGEMDFDDVSDLQVAAVSNAAGFDFESDLMDCVCGSVLQCVAVCCSVLQSVNVLQRLQCVADFENEVMDCVGGILSGPYRSML